MPLVVAIAVVLVIIYGVPLLVYGGASALHLVQTPDQSSPQAFLLGILVTKLGTALVFVLLLHITRSAWDGRWLLYGVLWFVMFAASEIGDAISRRSSWSEAMLGVVAEAVYAPASAAAAFAILGGG